MKRNTVYIAFFIVSTLLYVGKVHSQAINADSLYAAARSQAYNQQYDSAIATLQTILLSHPKRYDAHLLLGSVYGWNQQYSLARATYREMLKSYSTVEVYRGAGRVEMWDRAWANALVLFDQGLEKYPEDTTLHLLRIQTLAQLGRTDEAINLLENDLASLPQADSLLNVLRPLNTKNAVRVGYYYAHFDKFFSPWQIGTLEYQRRTKLGSIIGRVSTARMFDQIGRQAEIDIYPKITSRTYAYINMGISDRTVFPDLRWGAEIFQGVGSSTEVSAGIRMLYFDPIVVQIYTAQIGHYAGSHWISARGFLTNLQSEQTVAGAFTYRKYLNHSDHYISLYANYGNSPLRVVTLPEMLRLTTERIAVDYVHPFMQRTLLIHLMAEYQHETYDELRQVNRWGAEIRLEKRF